ncbi:MAG: TonB-dependent receptor [Bacteroidota bacterium]
MIRKLYLLLFLLIPAIGYSQTGSITGTILDKETNEPLIGATILVKGLNLGSIADLEGKFVIDNVPAGDQKVLITFVGFADIEKNVLITSGQTFDLGVNLLDSDAIGLKEVEIFSSVVDDRNTPIAISAISAEEIDQRFSGAEITDVAATVPGVYSIQGAGGYGDSEVYIRGFDQSNVAFLVNGIPVNDMENGRMFWSNFAGLSEVTRQIQVQRGLGASKLAISSIGGTVNMITKPADRSEGGRIEFQSGTGSWNNRLRFSYNSGQTANGWAVSFQGSRTTTNGGFVGLSAIDGTTGGIRPGAFTDAWAYYLAISKKINAQHQITFWGFGAPVNRGTAWTADEATRDEFAIDNVQFNNALGIYRGELINARQNKSHKPTMALSHYWDFDATSSISTSVYLSLANVYSTSPRDANSSLFFPTRTLGDPQFTSDNLINWDYLAEQNRSNQVTVNFPNGDRNTPSITGFASQYYLEARYNNHRWIGLISNFRKKINKANILAGVDFRHYKGFHYAEAFDLFGGDFILNQSAFGDDLNKLEPNGVVREGERTNYDYDGLVNWASAFGQIEYEFNKMTLFGTATVSNSWYQRVGNFWNGRDIHNLNSLGRSEQRTFLTYTLKAGLSYRPNNRHNFYGNGGYFTRPPFFRNSFDDTRYSNQYLDGLTVENVSSAEVGYSYRTSLIKVNFNAYFTLWQNRTLAFDVITQGEVDNGTNVLPTSLTGLESTHKGIEMDFTYNVTPALELSGFLSLGDWYWSKDVDKEFIELSNSDPDTTTVNVPINGLPVGTTAQTTAGFGFHYRGIRNMYLGARWQYSDRIAIRFSPDDLLAGFITREVIQDGFDDFFTVDLYAGRYFDFSDNIRGRLNVGVRNLFNAEYVRWASYFFNQAQLGFGFPRTYTIGLNIEF